MSDIKKFQKALEQAIEIIDNLLLKAYDVEEAIPQNTLNNRIKIQKFRKIETRIKKSLDELIKAKTLLQL